MTGLLTKPEIEFHEVASIFPMMSGSEYEALKADIAAHGLREPIWLHEGKIIDGRNRYNACREMNVTPDYRTWNGVGSLVAFVVSLNLHRRHLSESQRGMVAAKLANIELGENQHNIGSANLQTHKVSRAEAAELLNVSERTVNAAAKVKNEGAPELVVAVESGQASVSAAAEVATLPVAEQAEIVAKGEAEILAAAKRIKAERAGLVRGTFGTGENEWYTPAQYIDTARKVLGRIDLDPASSEIANETVKAAEFYTSHDNGLTRDWHGNVWLNPPYSQPSIAQFADKMVEEWQAQRADAAIVLTHNYTDTAWFQKLASHATAICFTRGRVRFVSADGEVASPTQGQAFFYFGSDLARFIEEFREIGFVVEVR